MVPWKVSAFWFVVLQGLAIYVFWYTSEARAWWLSAAGYLSSLLAFGALIELAKGLKRVARLKQVGNKATARLATSGGLTKEEREILESPTKLHDVITIPPDSVEVLGAYGKTLAESPNMLKPLSALPYPKETIRRAIETALHHVSDAALQTDLQRVLVALDCAFRGC